MVKTYKFEGLCCAHCAQKIEDAINKVEGVNSASIAFMTSKLKLDVADDKLDSVLAECKKIIKKIEPDCTLLA